MIFINIDSAIYMFLSMKLACGHKCSVFCVKTIFLIKIFLSMGQKSDQTLKNVNADRSSFLHSKMVFINGVCPLIMARQTSRSPGMPPQPGGLPFEIHWHAKVHHGTERCMYMDLATFNFLRHFFKFHISVLLIDIFNTVSSAHRTRDMLCEAELMIPVLRQNLKPCSMKTYLK